MRPPDPRPPQGSEFSASGLFVLLAPLIAVGAFGAALAILAAFLDWHPREMLYTAGGIGMLVVLPAVYLAYRQMAERSATRRALLDAEARVGGIVESAMDAIISVDERQRIVTFNAAAERVFRWPRGAVMGQTLDVLIPERYRARAPRAHRALRRTADTSRGMGRQQVLARPARRRRGIPDRGLDLAARRERPQALHRDPARRDRARALASRCSRAARRACAASSIPPWTRSSP